MSLALQGLLETLSLCLLHLRRLPTKPPTYPHHVEQVRLRDRLSISDRRCRVSFILPVASGIGVGFADTAATAGVRVAARVFLRRKSGLVLLSRRQRDGGASVACTHRFHCKVFEVCRRWLAPENNPAQKAPPSKGTQKSYADSQNRPLQQFAVPSRGRILCQRHAVCQISLTHCYLAHIFFVM